MATNTLATKENKWKRTLELDATCNICGNGTENEHHAVIMCTKSRALRDAMREIWNLPAESKFWYTGENWLQVALDSESEEMRAKILLLLWRCWHLREDCIRNNGRESIGASVQFLKQYEEDLKKAAVSAEWTDGKAAETSQGPCTRADVPPDRAAANTDGQWIPPDRGVAKINTDASFLVETGESTAGAVARDYRGFVFVSVCRRLPRCHSVEEAEGRAILVGLQTLAGLFNGQVALETDNQVIAKELMAKNPTRSPNYGLIMDIKKVMASFSTCSVQWVMRSRNSLAHGLAAETRSTGEQTLISDLPNSLRPLMLSECTAPF